MALALTALTSGSDATRGTSATTASITPTANALVIVDVYSIDVTDFTPTTPTLSGNSLTWEQVDTITYLAIVGDDARITRFRSMGASPSTGSITISFGAESEDTVRWSVYEITGVDTSGTNGSGAVVQTVTAEGTSTAPSATLAAFGSANNMAIGFIGSSGDGAAGELTEGSGFTAIHEISGAIGDALLTEYKLNDTTVDASISDSVEWAVIASEIKQSVNSGPIIGSGLAGGVLAGGRLAR